MYEQYYNYALLKMENIGVDPIQIFVRMDAEYNFELDVKIAKEAIENAFVHYFRCRGVKIENLKIYWNEPN